MKIFKQKWSKWQDIGCFDVEGHYKLLQMRQHIGNNKKQFRQANIGFINDYTVRQKIYDYVMQCKNN